MGWFRPGAMLQAQADIAVVCGSGEDADWLCGWVFRATDNELLARTAMSAGVLVRVVMILALAAAGTMIARRAISRFASRMERQIELRLERAEARGTLDVERYRLRRFQRLHAIAGAMRGVAAAVIWVVALFAMLDVIGVSLQPILAGAGLVGIVVGFGAQQLVRDVLSGIAMLIEDQYGVGDWIEVDGRIGQVERVGLRVTSFRDLDGILHHVLNGYIQRVGNLSQEWSRSLLDVPLALDADIPTAKALIYKVAADLAQDPVWGADIIGEPEIWGVQDFGPDGLSIRLVIPTKPMANWDINRQLRERLKHAFEQANIRMQGRLVELGGMRAGYPVLTRQADDDSAAGRPRRRGIVPADVSPLDTPPREPAGKDGRSGEVSDDATPADITTELRMEQGPRPRPD